VNSRCSVWLCAGYLLQPAHRSELAAALGRAILAHSGRSEDSALEAMARQATAVLQVCAAAADCYLHH
jgi:hypothetical protein